MEDLKPGTESWNMTRHKVRHTLEEYGCFIAIYGGGEIKKQMVFESYGVEKYHESFNESMSCLLKIMKYRPSKADESNLGMAAHTDKNFLSILDQNQVNGLEVQIKDKDDDDEWVTVELLPSSFVVMATDVFMAWSNGRLRSPPHRVMMKGSAADRYSIALFTFKKGTVETPEEFVDDEHPPRFKPFDHYKYLDFFAKNPVYMDHRQINLFSGV
ncbi:hypothetical protein E3N88_26698 [Mikania micrantha]|uniref:Fe2OG dioxygenase domain-containing protein n=1 Tax=Mikania micrantha TaxID=192012 RepID=A0A5N6MVK0_9ASTR|nr:hypothetical protein E3N88_26698 [Mikania micrantha]